MQISVTIIARDEEANIGRALASVDFCAEVLVVDSGSTDRTVEIARSLGATVIHHEWSGYAAQKNFAAAKASHDWILSIDADEAVGPELSASIRGLATKEPDFAGFDFPRLARYCGKWIRHSGWYPDRKVRLYRRDRARWAGDFVHESVVVSGPIGHLDGNLLHYTCDTLQEHCANVERYTDLAAREIVANGQQPTAWKLLLGPPFAFAKSLFFQLGFMDGAAGLTIAWMAAKYVYLKHAKARKIA